MKLKKLLLASKVDEAVSGTGGNGGVLEGLLVDTVVGGTWLHRGMISHILKFLALFPEPVRREVCGKLQKLF